MGKEFRELDLSNAYLFAATMQDEEICRLVLQTVIGKEIKKVRVHTEHTIFYSTDFKCVRLDVYADDEADVGYNIEMENWDKEHLAKRSRYYQAEIDVASLKPGEDYHNLKPNYVIFICTFDPFGKGLYRYTFEPYCRECGIYLEDGTRRIFLSTKGKNEEEVPAELVHFLKYVENSTDAVAESGQDKIVSRIHKRVQYIKRNRKLEVGYMRLEDMLKRREEFGKAEGKIEDILSFLADLGEVPEEVQTCVRNETNLEVLNKWVKLAAKSKNIEEFKMQM